MFVKCDMQFSCIDGAAVSSLNHRQVMYDLDLFSKFFAVYDTVL